VCWMHLFPEVSRERSDCYIPPAVVLRTSSAAACCTPESTANRKDLQRCPLVSPHFAPGEAGRCSPQGWAPCWHPRSSPQRMPPATAKRP
jgi:hypothetical protein